MVIMLLSTACSGPQPLTIRSNVDSLASPDAQRKTHFVILPANKDVKEQDLQFQEFKAYVEKSLLSRGFSKAAGVQDGDIILFLSYGVGLPQEHQYSYEVPVWVDSGYYHPYYRRHGFYSGVTGYTQRIDSYTTYQRYLVLDAYDMAPYREQKYIQLWKTVLPVTALATTCDLCFLLWSRRCSLIWAATPGI